MKILFWNTHKRTIGNYVVRCAKEHDVDVICLAEHQNIDPDALDAELGSEYRWVCGPNDSKSKKIILFARNTTKAVADGPLLEQKRYIVWTFECKDVRYNIVALHMVDKRSEESPLARCHDARDILGDLHMREEQSGCLNDIVIGDFNADPFEPELISKDGFHSTLFKDVLLNKPCRNRAGETFEMLYNPVLHFLSEDTKCYGSYYRSIGFDCLYWHCYDQALVSHSLVHDVKNLEYLRTIAGETLVETAGPLERVSDHFPLLLTMGGD
jgi:exonuclease III